MKPPTLIAVLSLVSALAGCGKPPDAPETLDELCSYLFVHHPDEDPAASAAGLEQLGDWLDEHWLETVDGYQVSGLTEATVDSLDEVDRSVSGVLGVAVSHRSAHGVDAVVEVQVAGDLLAVHPNQYDEWSRTYLTDPNCFSERTCDRLEILEDVVVSLPLGVTSTNQTMNQYLWVETADGMAMSHRGWLPEPPVTSVSWASSEEQYYTDVYLPREGGSWRVQASWLVGEAEAVPDGLLLGQLVNSMNDMAENIEQWLNP